MKYELAVFDMDGTILNTLDDLTDATNHALRTFGYPEHSIEEVRFFVGNGMAKLIERATPEGISADERKKVMDEFLEYYKAHSADKTGPYPGIADLLKKLNDCMYDMMDEHELTEQSRDKAMAIR